MRTIYFRIITQDFTRDTEESLKQSICSKLSDIGINSIDFSSFSSYWKNPKQGELSAQCTVECALSSIQQLFADIWSHDTADMQWSTIYLPNVSFLWISE